MGVLLNGAVDPHRIRQQMKDVIELETRIAQITVSSAERRDEEKLYHALTIADLRNLAPFVSFFSSSKIYDFIFKGEGNQFCLPTARLGRLLSVGLFASQHFSNADPSGGNDRAIHFWSTRPLIDCVSSVGRLFARFLAQPVGNRPRFDIDGQRQIVSCGFV